VDYRTGKKPKQSHYPSTPKKPVSIQPGNVERQILRWSFLRFDPYVWHANTYAPTPFYHIASHLRSYESLTWQQIRIRSDRDHPIDPDRIISKARARYSQLGLDDYEELWRFRFTGEQRIWGVRTSEGLFLAIWWDPEHAICPSPLRHT